MYSCTPNNITHLPPHKLQSMHVSISTNPERRGGGRERENMSLFIRIKNNILIKRICNHFTEIVVFVLHISV
jgi:hypothetical protein